MRNLIVGSLGALWGASILIAFLLRGGFQGHGATRAGEVTGVATGVLLLGVGAYYAWRGFHEVTKSQQKRRRKKRPRDDF